MQRFQIDFSAIILDEIALEGLYGITIEGKTNYLYKLVCLIRYLIIDSVYSFMQEIIKQSQLALKTSGRFYKKNYMVIYRSLKEYRIF